MYSAIIQKVQNTLQTKIVKLSGPKFDPPLGEHEVRRIQGNDCYQLYSLKLGPLEARITEIRQNAETPRIDFKPYKIEPSHLAKTTPVRSVYKASRGLK